MGGWETHPHWKNLEIRYWGGEFHKVDEMVIKQIFKQRLSFFILLWQWEIHINYYEEHFWALISWTCPPILQDTVQYSCYLLTSVAKLSSLDVFAALGLWTYSIILRPKQTNKKSYLNSLKSFSEALTPRNLGVLKDSISYELWLLGSVELVEEDTGVTCFMKLSKIPFWKMLS